MKMRAKYALSLSLVLLQLLASFPFLNSGLAMGQVRRPSRPASRTQDGNMKDGLQFRLSEGSPVSESQQSVETAQAASLSDSDAQSVLRRLQPIKSETDDQKDFAIRDRSLPAPRTGRVIQATFPPPEQPAVTDTAVKGPLEVLRFSPEGAVPLAPQLSVTFSQPMVAVTSHSDTIAGGVPVKLTPQPQGKWRWIGTKTLLFETDTRFPMATDYTVEIPSGTRSATGGSLAASKIWKFSTPPPEVKSTYPTGGPHKRDPLMFVEFDQKIDSEAVLETIRVRAGGTQQRVRLATSEEVNADQMVSRMAANAEAGRWLAFRIVNATNNAAMLPADAAVDITVGPGTPSAEGPRKTTEAQRFSFRTYGPLRVIEYRCGYNENCTPFDQWSINFSNPLDVETFDKSQVKVEPEIQGLKTQVYANTLIITGLKKGRTTYRVALDPAIKDEFGQTLGESRPITFNVKSAPPALASAGDQFIVLDPSAQPRFSVYTINHTSIKVSLYKVGPENWAEFMTYMRSREENSQRTPPGRLVSSRSVPVAGQPDEMVETRIDLAPALEGGFGHVFIVVESPLPRKNRWELQPVTVWAQATQIGLDAFVDNSELVGWATSLKDGRPIDGVQMSIQVAQAGTLREMGQAVSGADGIARIALKENSGRGSNLLVARKGKDVAVMPENTYWWNEQGNWFRKEPYDALRWFVFDDRKMYRPGEEVHIKGWIRVIEGGKEGDVTALDGAARNVSYILRDSRGNEVLKGNLTTNALGGFDTKFKLPPTMNLGYTNLQLSINSAKVIQNSTHAHQFQVQEFRRPEFEVNATATEGPHFVGANATATVAASYYAGGGLPNADVNWQVTSTPGYFTPPNRSDFTFGKWIPWWIGRDSSGQSRTEVFTGRTDASGKHNLRIDFVSADPPRPYNVTAEASVTDVNRQAWNARTSLLVHPADLYVGIRSPRTFVQKGEPLIVQSIVTDLNGKAIAGREIRLRAVLLDWVQERGEWKQKEVNPQDCVVRSTTDAVESRFETKEGGVYRVTATIIDDRERENESELTLWVAGGKVIPKRDVEQEEVTLIPDRKDYQPGDTAEVLVQSPFYPAEGVMTLRRSGIVKTERFKMEEPSHTLRIPVSEIYIPNIYVQVDLVGATARTDEEGKPLERLPKRPAFASGSLNLSIPPASRKLVVQATPRDKALEPGGQTTVDLEVRDSKGEPVAGSEVAVVVVDEAILGLTSYRIGDPLWTFYTQRSADTSDYHLRKDVVLGVTDDLIGQLQPGYNIGGGQAQAAMAEMVAPSPAPKMAMRSRAMESPSAAFFSIDGAQVIDKEPIQVRQDFNALATFAPAVPTDSNGRATVQVKLPDNLTRYRVMAVAVAGGKQFGGGESAITARLPLMIRPSAPRFLNFGDKFELPVVVQNQTDSPMEVNIAARASNAEFTEGSGRRVTVPANDRIEVRFPTTTVRAGKARFQIAAVSGEWADAAEIELPVWTPATTEAFAVYGEVDQGAIAQPVKAPTDAIAQFGGLEITTSATQLQALTDAVLYLTSYPFECAEQLASRVMAVAALRDVLAAFEAKDLPKPEEMVSAVSRDIKRLQGLQNDDGGFAFWHRGDESWPYISIHVAHALQRAKEKNFEVPAEMMERSRNYLRNIERHIPGYYSAETRRALIAYSLNVRNRMGDRDTVKAKRLIAEAGLEGLSLESVGWLLPVLSGDVGSVAEVTAIRRHLNNRATEEAGTAHFVTSYGDGAHLLLHSDRRADGVILEALIGDQPQSDLIPKVVRGLLAHRKAGRWGNTQENAFVLLALDKYFNTYEKTTPDFVARAWLGQDYAGGHQFRGRTTDSQLVNVPMRYLVDKRDQQNLILSKEGQGRLYYRIGMQYAPASLELKPAEHGFTVERVYEAVEKADDVKRDMDGTWRIRAGAKVRVRLTMVAPSRRYHVALVDPLPAGLEAMNAALAVTGSIPQDPKSDDMQRGHWWWWRPWFEHQNLRDERVEAFASMVWEGVYKYTYVARATTPGVFIVPPTKAEEMYHPETFGRGSSDKVIVE